MFFVRLLTGRDELSCGSKRKFPQKSRGIPFTSPVVHTTRHRKRKKTGPLLRASSQLEPEQFAEKAAPDCIAINESQKPWQNVARCYT